MKRRTFLATNASVLLAGCLSRAGSPSLDETVDYGNVSVDVHASNTSPVLESDAEVENQFTEASPATLSVGLTNTADGERTIVGGPTIPLAPQRTEGEEHSNVLFLVPEDGTGVVVPGEEGEVLESDAQFVPKHPEGGCWIAASADMGVVDIGKQIRLGADESHAQEYVLLAHPDDSECLSRDTYVFTEVVRTGTTEFELEVSAVHS